MLCLATGGFVWEGVVKTHRTLGGLTIRSTLFFLGKFVILRKLRTTPAD